MGEIKGSKFIVRMSRTRVLVAAALVALSLPATGRAGTLYTVIPLTPSKSYAFGINSSGDVVGSSTDALGMERAFLYSGGSISYLPSLGGSSDQGRAINDSGAIVGLSNSRAFEYKNGAMIALSVESYGFGINNSGDAVGYARSASGDSHAFLYTSSNNQVKDLGTLGGIYSVGLGMNDMGQVVGSSLNFSANYRAFLYEGGTMKDLGTLGGSSGNAQDINNSGLIVGVATTFSGSNHAFLYEAGVMKDLGTLGGSYSIATAINEAGAIVGYSTTSSSENHAFLYRGGAMVDINSLINPASGWTISEATGINDSGAIVGRGYLPGTGLSQAVLLTPTAVPEPSGLVLLATGAAGLALAIRRRAQSRLAV